MIDSQANVAPVAAPEASAARPQIKAVLFDFGQVLSRGPNAVAWERMRATTGASPERFHQAYWESRHDYDRGTLNGTGYWHAVAKAAGHAGLNPAELETLYEADIDLWTDLNDPMVAWAHDLQRRGIRTGILSNIGDRMESGIRARLPWIAQFNHCTWSHRLLLAKPEPAIYRHAAEGLGVAPEEILFVDDREENIAAARSAGMQAIQYSTHEPFVRDLARMGFNLKLEPAAYGKVSGG